MDLAIQNQVFKMAVLTVLVLGLNSCHSSSPGTVKAISSVLPCPVNIVINLPCNMNTLGVVVGTAIQTDVTFWTNISQSTTVIAPIPNGFYDGNSCLISDIDLNPSKIIYGRTIFGVSGNQKGTYSENMLSQAYRNPGSIPVQNNGDIQITSKPISVHQEASLFYDQSLPTSEGYVYRDIPNINFDDDGYYGTSCNYAVRPTVPCGVSQTTVMDRISDCVNLNGFCSDLTLTSKTACEEKHGVWLTTAIWDGSVQCNGGESVWKLVSRFGSNLEVWQDQRTELLLSSRIVAVANWCQASGNNQLAPLTYFQSCNSAVPEDNDCGGVSSLAIIGNGSIGNIIGGGDNSVQTVRVIFLSSTSFTVESSTGTGCTTGGGIQTIAASPGAKADFTINGVCSFTLTQGTIPFAANDKFFLNRTNGISRSCASGALQPPSPVSYCAEQPGLNPIGETWVSGGYHSAKGKLGLNSSPSVQWRLPTLDDYRMAEVDGIRFVMPDMGIPGVQRPNFDSSVGALSYSAQEWSATVVASDRGSSWTYLPSIGRTTKTFRSLSVGVRCVGR